MIRISRTRFKQTYLKQYILDFKLHCSVSEETNYYPQSLEKNYQLAKLHKFDAQICLFLKLCSSTTPGDWQCQCKSKLLLQNNPVHFHGKMDRVSQIMLVC